MNYLFGVYMFFISVEDIRYKQIPVWMLMISMVTGVIYRFHVGTIAELVISVLPGTFMCVFSCIYSQSIGMADGMLAVAYGLFYGGEKTIQWLIWSFFLASIIGLICGLCRMEWKKQLPFVPFMFLTHVGGCL